MEQISITLPGGTTARCARWQAAQGLPRVLLASDDRPAEAWGEFAAMLESTHCVIAVPPQAPAVPVLKALGGTKIVVAHGQSGRSICSALSAEPGLTRSLVLAEYNPPPGAAEHASLNLPVLVLRGRQSRTQSHEAAVRLHEAIPASRLIEPEDCGDWPFGACPDAAAAAVAWFAGSIADEWLEFDIAASPAG